MWRQNLYFSSSSPQPFQSLKMLIFLKPLQSKLQWPLFEKFKHQKIWRQPQSNHSTFSIVNNRDFIQLKFFLKKWIFFEVIFEQNIKKLLNKGWWQPAKTHIVYLTISGQLYGQATLNKFKLVTLQSIFKLASQIKWV